MSLDDKNMDSDKTLYAPGQKNSEGYYCYKYPHATITADCVIFGFDGTELKILLVERGNEPFLGYWALPGGFMRMDESIEQAAERELREETNLSGIYMEQFKVFSRPGRDPRERVVTVAFIALVRPDDYDVVAGDDAAKAYWFKETMLPPLAFDHREIIADAREHLKEVLRLKPVAFELLNKFFSISELQRVYEVINGASYDRRNFLRTAIDSEVVAEVGELPTTPRITKIYKATVSISDSSFSVQESSVMTRHLGSKHLRLKPDADIEDIEAEDVSDNTGSKKNKSTAARKSGNAPTKGLFDFFSRKK